MKDRRSVGDKLEIFNMLSINQTAAQIKLQEAWKASKDQVFKEGEKKRGPRASKKHQIICT